MDKFAKIMIRYADVTMALCRIKNLIIILPDGTFQVFEGKQ